MTARAVRLWFGIGTLTLSTSCTYSASVPFSDPPCDPRPLTLEEVRVRTIFCGDDTLTAGDGGRGDTLLENNQIKMVFRDIGSSLARLEGTGGGIIDLALVDIDNAPQTLDDGVLDIVPVHQGKVLSINQMTPFENDTQVGIELFWTEQTIPEQSTRVWLEPNTPTIFFQGNIDWLWRPKVGTEIYGEQIHPPRENPNWQGVIQIEADSVDDLGGDIRLLHPTALHMALDSTQWQTDIEIETPNLDPDAQWIELYDQEKWIGRTWLTDQETMLLPPNSTHLALGAEGCPLSQPVPIDDLETIYSLQIDRCGSLSIQLYDDHGQTEGILQTDHDTHYIPRHGRTLQIEQIENPSILWTDITQEPIRLPALSDTYLQSHPQWQIDSQSSWDATEYDALHILTETAPSTTSRSLDSLWSSIGIGASHIIYLGQDIVPPIDDDIPIDITIPPSQIQVGILSNQEVLSWPWKANRSSGFGALDTLHTPLLALIEQANERQRFSAITPELFDTVRTDLWDHPDFIWLPTPTIDTLREQCDFRQSLPLGPWTWFDHTLRDSTPERALLDRQYSTGNGPKLQISQWLDSSRTIMLSLSIDHARWMGLEHWELWSEAGLEAQGEITTQPTSLDTLLPIRDHYCLLTWGTPTVHPFADEQSWGIRVFQTGD